MRLVSLFSAGTLPSQQRDEERAFMSTARHWRSQRDEFSTIRKTLNEAGELKTLDAKPLIVITAVSGAEDGWLPLQEELAALSTNSVHRVLQDATHAGLVENEDEAAMAAQAIRDVVEAVRAERPLTD